MQKLKQRFSNLKLNSDSMTLKDIKNTQIDSPNSKTQKGNKERSNT